MFTQSNCNDSVRCCILLVDSFARVLWPTWTFANIVGSFDMMVDYPHNQTLKKFVFTQKQTHFSISKSCISLVGSHLSFLWPIWRFSIMARSFAVELISHINVFTQIKCNFPARSYILLAVSYLGVLWPNCNKSIILWSSDMVVFARSCTSIVDSYLS